MSNKTKKIIRIVAISLFSVLAAGFALFAIAGAWGAGFATDVEAEIITGWEWHSFNIVVWGSIGFVINAIVVIAILVTTEDKEKKQVARQRRVQQI